jgi:hypothetical protein
LIISFVACSWSSSPAAAGILFDITSKLLVAACDNGNGGQGVARTGKHFSFSSFNSAVQCNRVEPMMTRFAVATTAVVLLGCGSAYAQIGGMNISPGAPLGITSPLGLGPGSPVAPSGIPMGATELASPGVSPMTSGISPLVGIAACSGVGGSLPQASPGIGTSMSGGSSNTGMFDGGGLSGSASGACAGSASTAMTGAGSDSSPTGMGSTSSVGRVGIPLGSTEWQSAA